MYIHTFCIRQRLILSLTQVYAERARALKAIQARTEQLGEVCDLRNRRCELDFVSQALRYAGVKVCASQHGKCELWSNEKLPLIQDFQWWSGHDAGSCGSGSTGVQRPAMEGYITTRNALQAFL